MGHAHLHAQEGSTDPTRTKTVRRTYGQRLRGGFARINTAIRRDVRDRDVFGLDRSGAASLSGQVDPLPSMFDRRQDRQIETFEAWLQRMQRDEVLSVVGRDENRFIATAYDRGIKHANGSLRRAGIDPDSTSTTAIARRPVHRDTLQTIYTRDYSDLENITQEVSTQANRELAEGFAVGEGPDDIARRLTERVDAIGKARATTLARTSVIDAHAAATLNRYAEHNVAGVAVQAELRTAGDSRVCAECRALGGTVYSIDEARSIIPVHANCRCAWLPVTSSTAAAAYEAAPDRFTSLFAAGAFADDSAAERYALLAATGAT